MWKCDGKGNTHRMVSATISRRLQEAKEQYQMDIDERRERFEWNNLINY